MENIKFLVIASGHNCGRYVEGCARSVIAQTYKNAHVIFIDDASTDETHSKAGIIFKTYFEGIDISRNEMFYYNIKESDRSGTVLCRDKWLKKLCYDFQCDVIVWLDLDDEIMPNALERLVGEYQDPECWLTYGNYIDSSGRICFNESNIGLSDEPIRFQDWKFIHLRSFRKELYFKLNHDDLFPKIAEVYPDISMLYSLMELAGREHIRPILDVLYKYNNSNPLNVTKRFPVKQRDAELAFIRGLPAKEALKTLW